MEAERNASPLDFSTRFRRAQGRMPRKCSATAKVTPDEHRELEAAANRNGKALGEWSREVLLTAARGSVADPSFTEIIAMRRLLNSVLRYVACGDKMTLSEFNAEMQEIRTTKHKAAEEIMQQYAITETTR